MATTFTFETLNDMTREQLRKLCTKIGITGMSKSRKDECVDAILASQTNQAPVEKATVSKPQPVIPQPKPISGIEFTARSILTKPNAKIGDKTTTTIHVSSGAASGSFPVIGKKVVEVSEFLREVLNVDSLSTPVVNGKTVDASYELRAGDNLEFLKPAGRKG